MSERPSKYHAIRAECPVCNSKHDSRRERTRCWELAQLERVGAIRYLRRQVRYRLDVEGVHVCDYIADFVYSTPTTEVVEDVKSVATAQIPVYRIKKKLMRAVHGIDIREV